MSAADPLKGYKGRARARLEGFSVRVWSDVRATNDAGSLFECADVAAIAPDDAAFHFVRGDFHHRGGDLDERRHKARWLALLERP